jgi:hypothetical protein
MATLARAQEPVPAPEVLLNGGAVEQARAAAQASQPPAYSIPVGALGFSAPGTAYLGHNVSMASLDFLDESHLLFTFRAPGLIERRAGESSGERHIRALVLSLPTGDVQAEALWTLQDNGRYLWMLRDGQFLLRNGDELQQGDAKLEPKTRLRFDGELLWMEMDPEQRFLVTETMEPEKASEGVGRDAAAAKRLTLRIVQRETGQVLLVSHPATLTHLPINADGFLEAVQGRDFGYQVNLHSFGGESRAVGKLESFCAPSFEFLSQQGFLASGCSYVGDRKLAAFTTDGRKLWESLEPETEIWPLLERSEPGANLTGMGLTGTSLSGAGLAGTSLDGVRLVRETLSVGHAVSVRNPLSTADVKGQRVRVYEAANGKVLLTAEASPVLDAGGNVAISPSGRQLAVLHEGLIEVFELAGTLVP